MLVKLVSPQAAQLSFFIQAFIIKMKTVKLHLFKDTILRIKWDKSLYLVGSKSTASLRISYNHCSYVEINQFLTNTEQNPNLPWPMDAAAAPG